MKRRARELDREALMRTLDALYTAASSIRGRSAMKMFLRDLLTESERVMLGRRILIARELLAGRSYNDIEEDMKVGRATIWRVQRWLEDQIPGYENAVREMTAEFAKREKAHRQKKMYATSALYRLKKKYPLHFLLFPWPKGSPERD